eukprot:gene17657-20112_t
MDINTTPLIDVMLVLLVMLIITIPIQLHSVNLDMPVGTPPTNSIKPEKIQIDIDENSVVYWQGQAVSAEQLEAKMASIGQLVSQPEDPSRRYKGIAIVVALHILIGWAIVSGTAKNALVALKKPLEAVVIQEVIIPPPPPPPPPKPIKPQEVPRVEAPPPPFVPPPDVAPPATSTAPVVQSVSTPPPTLPVIAPPVLPAPPKPAPNRSDIRVACPTQVQPEMPRRAIQHGTEGVVRAQALIKEGAVKEVTILSGPSVFHAAVRAAMLQYKCTAESGEITATQEFVFKNE